MKFQRTFGAVFTGVGILLAIIGIIITIASTTSLNNFKEYAEKTEAVISDIALRRTSSSGSTGSNGYTTDVFVEFYANGNTVSAKLNYYSSNMRIGDSIVIYFDPRNPTIVRAEADPFIGMMLLVTLCGMGLIFSCIGAMFLVAYSKKNKLKKRLIENGRYIFADIVNVQQDHSIKINGRYLFIIECKYSDGVNDYRYASYPINYDPTHLIGTKIRIWIDRMDNAVYYVDTDSIKPGI